MKKNICIITTSLGKGGAERLAALLSIMLDRLNYQVHVVSVLNNIDFDFGGTLLNLGELKEQEDTFLGRIKRFYVFKNYLKNQKFDLIIDNRTRPNILKELLISKLLYKNQKVIYMLHNWNLQKYFSNSKFWAKQIYKNDSNRMYIGVSKAISRKAIENYNLINVKTIYNAIDLKHNITASNTTVDYPKEYILFFGRLDDTHKNISLLMDAYKASKLPSKGINLLILGNGIDLDRLTQKAESDKIIFKPFQNNPFPYIKHAKFCCLTSRFEGFPMAILESLSVGTPMVSVNCQSGPNEVIIDKHNGLLVENYNVDALAKAMNSFIFDESLYNTCKSNAQKSVENFSVDEIAQQWKKLIDNWI